MVESDAEAVKANEKTNQKAAFAKIRENIKIAPSVLAADFAQLKLEVDRVTQAGADWLHVDIMDGHFVPNLTIGPPVVAALKRVCHLPLDVHLMIEQPEKSLDAYIEAGASYLTIHLESTTRVEECLTRIRQSHCGVGLTLRPGTPVSALDPFLEMVDLVLVMTVEPGYGGQQFMPNQVHKLEWLAERRLALGLKYLIEVDGGVSDVTTAHLAEADVLVAGNFVFSGDVGQRIQSLRRAHQSARLSKGGV